MALTRRSKKVNVNSRKKKRSSPLQRGGATVDETTLHTLKETMFETMKKVGLPYVAVRITNEDSIQEVIRIAIQRLHLDPKVCIPKPDKWAACTGDCYTIVSRLIGVELASTYYVLQALRASTLPEPNQITFTAIAPLTGVWDIDKARIQISILGDRSKRSRLLMGYGPSASGKTHWAKTIIELLGATDTSFPTVFLCIDGGIYRETSIVYKAVIKAVENYCVKGIDNLVVTSVAKKATSTFLSFFSSEAAGTGLFQSDAVKETLREFLAQEKRRDPTLPISLYVPETLAVCGIECTIDKEYFTITNDEASWIGLLIWQHKEGAACDEEEAIHRCVGCTKSGYDREGREGKRYSNSNYDASFANGETMFLKGKGGRYKIHNCGREDGISIFEDYTLPLESENNSPAKLGLKQKENQRRYKYRYDWYGFLYQDAFRKSIVSIPTLR